MKTVKIKDLELGSGKAKLAVCLVGGNEDEIIREAKLAASDDKVDLVEWRSDYFDDVLDIKKVVEVVKKIRKTIKEKPLIFSFRTKNEGGKREISSSEYLLLFKTVLLSKCVDCVDIEFLLGDTIVNNIIKHAKIVDKKVLISNHDLDSTPATEILVKRLKTMASKGADIVKIGMTPRSAADVDALIEASKEASKSMPIIAVSMGDLGKITRIDATKIGSSMTFGYLEEPNSPGQIEIEELYRLSE